MSDPTPKLLKTGFDLPATSKAAAFFDVRWDIIEVHNCALLYLDACCSGSIPAKTFVARRISPKDYLLSDFG